MTASVLVSMLALATLAGAQEKTPREAAFSGQDLVRRAAAQMTQHPSLEAKIRQRIAMFDQYLSGNGYYQHLRYGGGSRFRMELRMQVGEDLTSLLQVNDGRYLWTRRDFGKMKSLGRIDLERVRNALKERETASTLASTAWFGVGGFSQLLQGLNDNFEFGQPTPDEINGVGVWQVRGQWNRDALAKLLPGQADSILAGQPAPTTSLPSHLPDQVRLVLGRGGHVPLFPYRVEFSRRDPDSHVQRPMMAIEAFEVRLRPDFDPRRFAFALGEQRVEDETDAHLRKLGLSEPE